MLVSGWILFIVGFALIFFGAFVGVEGLMNLPSTLSAVAFMISGAIFVGIDKLDQILDVLKTPAPKSADTLALPERKTRSVSGEYISSTAAAGDETNDKSSDETLMASDTSSDATKSKSPAAEIYRDAEITRDGAYCVVGDRTFFSLHQAKQFIDRQKGPS
tara:strand:- start:101 stop:583 length:483 start_codon:yes stop_codon:yes gene_type:complete